MSRLAILIAAATTRAAMPAEDRRYQAIRERIAARAVPRPATTTAPTIAKPRPLPWWVQFFADHGRLPTLAEERATQKARRAKR